MPYDYKTERPKVFTEDGQRMFLAIRDKTKALLKTAGAARCQEMIKSCGGGSSFTMLACVDRMIELAEIREITVAGCAGQCRVFVSMTE